MQQRPGPSQSSKATAFVAGVVAKKPTTNTNQLLLSEQEHENRRTIPMFVKKEDNNPDVAKDHSTNFSHRKSPWYPRNTKKKKSRTHNIKRMA